MLLSELFHTINPKDVKIHLAVKNYVGDNPLHRFWNNEFKEWQEWQNKRNFERPYILSLIQYSSAIWLFAGIYKKNGRLKVDDHYQYQTELTDINQSIIGRLLVEFKRTFRNSYPNADGLLQEMKVSEILKFPSTFQHFPGYDNVCIPFSELKPIILTSESTWKTALQNMKGVYLITDTDKGNQYVGSAYGDKAFWNRWKEYVTNGHGGNKLLKEVVKQEGFEYTINHYQISILEIMNSNSSEEDIINRESFWKKMLGTKAFGLNSN